MNIAALVLAAGASRRLGEPKQLVRIGKETLLERSARVCREAGCDPVVVVLGASAELIASKVKLPGIEIVINELWEEGLASSIRAGVGALPKETSGCIILTCDMPSVSSTHLQKLAASSQMTASSYNGRHGVPAFFPSSAYGLLMRLRGDSGARELLREAPAVELAGGELDIDTLEDLQLARSTIFRL